MTNFLMKHIRLMYYITSPDTEYDNYTCMRPSDDEHSLSSLLEQMPKATLVRQISACQTARWTRLKLLVTFKVE